MYEIKEIPCGADAPQASRRFRVSDPETHFYFEVTAIQTLNIAHYDEINRHVGVQLLNGQAADALVQLAARLSHFRVATSL